MSIYSPTPAYHPNSAFSKALIKRMQEEDPELLQSGHRTSLLDRLTFQVWEMGVEIDKLKEENKGLKEMTKKLLHCETENAKLHIALKDKWGECEYTKEQNDELKKENEELKEKIQIGEVGNHERKFFIETTTKLEEENKELKEKCDNGDCNGGRKFKNESGKGEFCSYECADEDESDEEQECCFLGCEETFHYGNNAAPIIHNERCCDECNAKHVIPARLATFMKEDYEYENCETEKEPRFGEVSYMVAGGGLMNGNAYATIELKDKIYYYCEYGKNASRRPVGNKIVWSDEIYDKKNPYDNRSFNIE